MPDINWPLCAAVVHPNLGGWLGGLITKKNITPWYQSLKKPSWTPPSYAFGPVWTSLYCSMGYASHLVWKETSSWEDRALPLGIYGANLALNWAWTPIFFGMHNIKWAFYEISVLWGSTALLGAVFYKVNRTAGLLIIPYFAWMSLATALNYVIYRDNNEENSGPKIASIKEKK